MPQTAKQTSPGLLEQLRFDNSFARLPEYFYSRVNPTPFDAPHHLLSVNREIAALLGIDPAKTDAREWIDLLGGHQLAGGCEPLACFRPVISSATMSRNGVTAARSWPGWAGQIEVSCSS